MARHGAQTNASDHCYLPPLGSYIPTMFLRCHNQKENDTETKVWKCAYEPSLDNPDKLSELLTFKGDKLFDLSKETTNLLATCGGKSICIIDVEANQVLKRFQDTDKNENNVQLYDTQLVSMRQNFYTLAWTTIDVGDRKVNILAVAGEAGAVKLIQPEKNIMYAAIREHKKYISCLLFHSTFTRLLFSGSKDGFVFLWDIGIPDEVPVSNYMPLLKISLQDSVGDALNLVFSEASQLLIAGAERGCIGWIVTDCPTLTPVRRARVIEKADIYFRHPKAKNLTVDGLIILPGDLIATKQVGSGEILIWSLSKHAEKQKREVVIEPLIKLKYPQHSVKYLNLGYNNGLLGVGDDHGNLLLYNIKEVISKYSCEDDENVWETSDILEWPNIVNNIAPAVFRNQELVVNTVAISSSHKFVTGGTDNNLVCIWKREQEETPTEIGKGLMKQD